MRALSPSKKLFVKKVRIAAEISDRPFAEYCRNEQEGEGNRMMSTIHHIAIICSGLYSDRVLV